MGRNYQTVSTPFGWMPSARYVLAKLHEVAHQSAYSASSLSNLF